MDWKIGADQSVSPNEKTTTITTTITTQKKLILYFNTPCKRTTVGIYFYKI